MQGGSIAGTESSNLQRYASFMQSPTPSLRLAAAALCSVLSKQFNRYTGRSKLDSELGGAVTSTLLSLIEHEPELRARAAFTFGESPPLSSCCHTFRRHQTFLTCANRPQAYHVADEPNMQQRAVAAQCLNVFRALLAENVKQENPYPTPATLEELGRVREVRSGTREYLPPSTFAEFPLLVAWLCRGSCCPSRHSVPPRRRTAAPSSTRNSSL